MITHNRFEYTKKAVEALMNVRGCLPFIFDNASTDGTAEWLRELKPIKSGRGIRLPLIYFSKGNVGISGAINFFLSQTQTYDFVAKCDNDTILPADWVEKMMPHMKYADIVQSKHAIIKATHPEGWKGFTRGMERKNGLLYNHFVGGSGVMMRRAVLTEMPTVKWVLGPWREWQKQNPKVTKAFCEDVEIKLLDEHGYGDYPEYYAKTGRI